jgi:hypothetical protein
MKKYIKGDKITNLDELVSQQLIIFESGEFSKVYSYGGFMGWKILWAKKYIDSGVLYKAVKNVPKNI